MVKGGVAGADGRAAGRLVAGTGGWHPVALLGVLALWLATVGNGPLWLAVVRQLREGGGAIAGPVLLWGAALNLALLAWAVWPRWRRLAGIVLLALVALPSHFMLSYGVVIDPSMAANVLHTDLREAGDLIGPTLLVVVALGVVLPGYWWWRQPVRAVSGRHRRRCAAGRAGGGRRDGTGGQLGVERVRPADNAAAGGAARAG